jgi:ankyrin repeat protein
MVRQCQALAKYLCDSYSSAYLLREIYVHKPLTVLVALLCSAFAGFVPTAKATDTSATGQFERVIRANDQVSLKKMAVSAAAVNITDKLHSTALHYAALYGSPEAVRILLNAGADPNAKNDQGVTPLVYAAYNLEKTRMLVEKGADVNAAGSAGITPLMIAASVHNNAETVRYLLAKGAQVKAIDSTGSDALMRAAGKSESEVVQLLLAKGADPKRADQAGFTALQDAAACPGAAKVTLLLSSGADPNAANSFAGQVKNGPIALIHLTPLMLAAPFGHIDKVNALLKAGARVNEVDSRKMSPLMLAVATDHADAEVVGALIAAGSDVNAKDRNGESILDWARKFRRPEVLNLLEKAGAQGREPVAAAQPPPDSQPPTASEAIARALPLLSKAGPQFFREGGGCGGCHHQPIYARTFAAVASAGGHPDSSLRQSLRDMMLAERPRILRYSTLLLDAGGLYDPAFAQLEALSDLHEPANLVTDSMVHYIAVQQQPSGAWSSFGESRAPLEDSDISRTAAAIRVLRDYGWPARREEFDERLARARAWLEKAQPVTSYESADRINGLRAAGMSVSELRPDVEAILKQQHGDGGWSQNEYLQPDAYATGLVLHALYSNGFLKPDDPIYRKGVAFLLRTQFPDGSWYVRSRAPKFQPYFQSGFPFDHDQWISSAGTAWALMAVAPAMQ